ncbi:MAG: two-component system, OmpR family, sensor histidine kinase KdpD [Actinomycetota bacterium]|nr:two-component system, OmpR family, sensor histidine kinase KdpD [Actinomycetota bacterium]
MESPRLVIPPLAVGLPRWRRVTGLVVGVSLPVALTVGLKVADTWVGLAGDSLVLLLAVVVTAMVGGLWPALISAVIGSTLLNYFFIPPLHTLLVSEPHNVITLVVFVLVAGLVSTVVQRAATLACRASRASAESRSLAAMASGVLRGEEALPTLLEHVRSAFGMTSVSLLERVVPSPGQAAPASWRVVDARGVLPPAVPVEADVSMPAGDNLVLALSGRLLATGDRMMLRAFAAQVQGLLERDRLARAAAHATRLEATERLRDALLAALGHDLRTPLASARAAVNSLQACDVDWTGQERRELLATADESLGRLTHLVSDLLDLSRLQAGVLTVTTEPVWLEDLIPPALDELAAEEGQIEVRLSEDTPPVMADAALLARALVNVIGNALRHAPAGNTSLVTAGAVEDHVEIRVIDRGRGVPEQDKERIFVPFQRLGDTDNTTGLGLGLALSRGLVEAMNGTLEAEDTPGGGLTMLLTLPAAWDEALEAAEPGRRERGDQKEPDR